MAIINGPKEINEKELLKSIASFSTDNKLTKEENDELEFVCKSFAKYYNSLSSKRNTYSPKMIAESFEEMLKNSILVDKWSGLTTRANLFYKQVPYIEDVLSNDTLDHMIAHPKNSDTIENGIRNIRKDIERKTNSLDEKLNRITEMSKTKSEPTGGYCGGRSSFGGPSC